jgi:DNA-binding NtrC family response regulator
MLEKLKPRATSLREAEREFRIEFFQQVLQECDGDIVEAAKRLDISISTAYRIQGDAQAHH